MTADKNEMWKAAKLALKIDHSGCMPQSYKHDPDLYKSAGFSSDVFSCAGGANGIHAGLVGRRTDGNICMSFRGTDGGLDWINDIVALQVSFSLYGKGSVHKGFYDGIRTIADDLQNETRKLYDENPNALIYITGHSKGGALATLMGKMMETFIPDAKVEIYTYGSPRVGDPIFKENYRKTHLRCESFLDLIPHLCLSSQETVLLPRLEGLLSNIWGPFLKGLPPYVSVGERYCFKVAHKSYGKLPMEPDNPSGETLNSLCAVEQIVRGLDIDLLLNEIHNKDYNHM